MDNPLAPKQKTIRLGEVELTLTEAGWLEDMRLYELEKDAVETNKKEFEGLEKGAVLSHNQLFVQYFRRDYYPKLAACVLGEAPDLETALKMPSKYRQVWYNTAHELNPAWFAFLDEIAKQITAQNDIAIRKKKGRKRAA